MSIRHCIAGVVLVVISGLAVNAYQDQPPTTPAEVIRRYEAELNDLQAQQKKLTDRITTVQDRVRELKTVEAARAGATVTTGALVLADEGLPTPNAMPPVTSPYLTGNTANAVGRYQFYQKERDVPTVQGLLLDTATGRCWMLNGLAWTDVANPTETKAAPHVRSPLDPPDPPDLNLKPTLPPRGSDKPRSPLEPT